MGGHPSRHAFVKAVSATQNEHSPHLHRAGARVTAALPSAAPTPKLLGVGDDGDWEHAGAARHPAPPGLRSLREFQQAQADVVVAGDQRLRCSMSPAGA